MTYEIFDARDGSTIDRCPSLEWAIKLLIYYYELHHYCTYGIRPML